jgi:hypothetical protein
MRPVTYFILWMGLLISSGAGCKDKEPEPVQHKMTRPKLPEMPKQ